MRALGLGVERKIPRTSLNVFFLCSSRDRSNLLCAVLFTLWCSSLVVAVSWGSRLILHFPRWEPELW